MEKINFADTTPIPETGEHRLRRIYLERLERVLTLRMRHDDELNPQGIRLLDHAVFAAYCDCRDLGIETEARQLVRSASDELATQLTLSARDASPHRAAG